MADTGTPVGLICPGCSEPPFLLMGGGTQAFCGTDDCPFFTWDPTKTLAELNAGAKRTDLRPAGPAKTPETEDGQ
jgi:hypothetical protein